MKITIELTKRQAAAVAYYLDGAEYTPEPLKDIEDSDYSLSDNSPDEDDLLSGARKLVKAIDKVLS